MPNCLFSPTTDLPQTCEIIVQNNPAEAALDWFSLHRICQCHFAVDLADIPTLL